ncbi:MAG: hypothetical protein Q8934_03235 [Bacillota bacterium]|nr:hypothetical protein [Bacillota bacterium]
MSLLVGWIESLYQDITITNVCARKKCVRSNCSQCIRHCEKKALFLQENEIFIDLRNCNSCGECIIHCPLSAIKGSPPIRNFTDSCLIYDESPPPSLKEMLIYKKLGIKTILTKKISLDKKWQDLYEKTNRILPILEQEPFTIKNGEERKISRRELLSAFHKEGQKLAQHMTPVRWKKEVMEWKLSRYYPAYQFYEVEWEQNHCSLCQACFNICPESVFSLNESKVTIANGKCVGCQMCQDVCKEKALLIIPKIKKKNNFVIPVFTKKCLNCGKLFYTFTEEKGKCPICRDRDPSWLNP